MGARAGWVLVAAMAAGASYPLSWLLPLEPTLAIAWKGAGVVLLAVYAALAGRGTDGRLLTAVMAFGAAGDVLLETSGLAVGAVAFFAGHLTAVWLYLRNRRAELVAPDIIPALTLAIGTPLLAWALPADRAGAPQAAVYALGLGAMAATAWLGRFPRRLTALGAVMFVASDELIFLRTGRPMEHALWMGLAVWGLYFAGQALIVIGVTRARTAPPAA